MKNANSYIKIVILLILITFPGFLLSGQTTEKLSGGDNNDNRSESVV